MVGCSDSAAEWLRLLDVCRDLTPLLDGQVRNFVVLPFGAANSQGAVTWVRAHIQTAHSMEAPHTVALKIRTADWLAVRFNQGHLKAVQATFCDEKPYPILDLSGPESVLVASVNIRNAECLQVAEVFCGGFSGWAQGVTLLHSAAMPLQLAWRLDWDPSVNKYLQTQHPALRVISTPAALEEVLPHEDILLQVDAFEVWWLRMQSARQVHIMTVSAPCPAWSNAARSRGLHSREGSLLLHMAGVCGCLGIPVVALEQVDHFPKHADYEAVMTAWRSAGYVQVWSAVLDLLDLLPASRRRFLAVLVHKESGLPLLPLAGENWLRCNIPTLARADAIFPLPAQLRSSLTLPQSVLQQYLDPALLPGSVARRHGSAPTQYRVRGFTWYLPPELAVLVRLTFPYHLLLPLGWRAHCPGQPVPTSAADARAADSVLIVKPKVPAPVMPLSELQHLMCVWLLRAQLCALAESHPAPDCPVEVQLLHQHIWFGSLPGDFCLQALADMWQAAAIAVQLPPACRIYSGPFAKDPATRLADLHLCPARVFHSRIHAQPVLTVHTEIHGGGQKTETKEWARSQLAATCLSRGIELSHTTEFVEKLVAQTNPRNLSKALHQKQAAEQWEAVERLAQDLGLPLPEPSLSNPRTEARLQKAVAARKLNKQHDIKVEDVEIRSGFFKNADSSPATVLAALKPGACGVFLTSVDQAVEVLETLSGVRPDELCVVVLGHCCPQHSTCSGPIVFPAVSRQSGHSMLLAGCYHNVGGTPIQPGLESDGVLPMPKVALCAFEAHAAEFEDEIWSRLCGAPVRAALDLFADGGVPHAFTMPWGRRHLCRGRACPPAQADWVGFQAKVDDASLCAVLEVSGHNGIYCTPRDHERVLSKSFAIIWLGPDKSSCVKASLQVVEQKGLAYARGRYGLRVPAEHFERAHRQLKPGADVPSRLAVTQVYRVGPIPQSAGAAELKQWSDKIKWPVKILRASGPTHWVLGSDRAPPSAVLGWNGVPVLASLVDPAARPRSVLQSGKPPAAATVAAVAPAAEAPDPWLHNDPWKAAAKPAASLKSAPDPRTVPGPIEQRFQQQESRLQSLEQDLQKLRDEQQQHRTADRASFAQGLQEVERQVSSLGKDFASQLKASVQAMQDSQTRQQEQMQSSLEDLKAIFLTSPQPPRKARREDEPSM